MNPAFATVKLGVDLERFQSRRPVLKMGSPPISSRGKRRF